MQEQHEEMLKHQKPADAASQTPWVWVPKDLEDENAPPTSSSNGAVNGDSQRTQSHHEHSHSRHRQRHSPQTASSTSEAQSAAQAQTHIAPQVKPLQWPGGKPPPQEPYRFYNEREREAERQAEEQRRATPVSAPPSSSTFSQYVQQKHSTAPLERTPPNDASVSSASSQARAQTADDMLYGQQQLKPTFSPKIVRTPIHYSSLSSASAAAALADSPHHARRSTRDESTSTPTPDRRVVRENRSQDRHVPREDDSPPPRPHTHGPIYGPPTRSPSRAPSDPNGTDRQSSVPSLTSSLSTLSISPTSTLTSEPSIMQGTWVEEPSSLLSPLLVSNAPKPHDKSPLGRSQTYPMLSASSQTNVPAIPEEPSTGGQISRTSSSSKTPKASPSHSPHHPRTPSSVSRSRTYPSLDSSEEIEDPVIPPYPSASAPRTPVRSNSLRNPLPPPPRDIASQYLSTASASVASQSAYNGDSRTSPRYPGKPAPSPSRSHTLPASAYSSATGSQPPYSVSSASASASASTATSSHHHHHHHHSRPQKVRAGFWNKRGDHLVIVDGPNVSPSGRREKKYYVVYAPPGQTYPEELASYPPEDKGWGNIQDRSFIQYSPSYEELPESLPRRGQPPPRPYESVRVYFVGVCSSADVLLNSSYITSTSNVYLYDFFRLLCLSLG